MTYELRPETGRCSLVERGGRAVLEVGTASAKALRQGPVWSVGGLVAWLVWRRAEGSEGRAAKGQTVLGPVGHKRSQLFLFQKKRLRVGKAIRPRSSRQNEEVAQAE